MRDQTIGTLTGIGVLLGCVVFMLLINLLARSLKRRNDERFAESMKLNRELAEAHGAAADAHQTNIDSIDRHLLTLNRERLLGNHYYRAKLLLIRADAIIRERDSRIERQKNFIWELTGLSPEDAEATRTWIKENAERRRQITLLPPPTEEALSK